MWFSPHFIVIEFGCGRMGFKDRMMKVMIGRMSKEEKLEMMDKMMEEFLSDFTKEEMMEMMMKMMPKMMSQMMGSGGMAGMMENMFKPGEEGKANMKEMMEFCSHMMEGADAETCSQMMNRCMEFMKKSKSE